MCVCVNFILFAVACIINCLISIYKHNCLLIVSACMLNRSELAKENKVIVVSK
jgi:hypothetical protein